MFDPARSEDWTDPCWPENDRQPECARAAVTRLQQFLEVPLRMPSTEYDYIRVTEVGDMCGLETSELERDL